MWVFFGELCIEEIYMWGCAGMRGFIQGCMCVYIYIYIYIYAHLEMEGCMKRGVFTIKYTTFAIV